MLARRNSKSNRAGKPKSRKRTPNKPVKVVRAPRKRCQDSTQEKPTQSEREQQACDRPFDKQQQPKRHQGKHPVQRQRQIFAPVKYIKCSQRQKRSNNRGYSRTDSAKNKQKNHTGDPRNKQILRRGPEALEILYFGKPHTKPLRRGNREPDNGIPRSRKYRDCRHDHDNDCNQPEPQHHFQKRLHLARFFS